MNPQDEAIVARLRAEPPHHGAECPVCRRDYEQPFTVNGQPFDGYQPGSGRCLSSRDRGNVNRAARARKAAARR